MRFIPYGKFALVNINATEIVSLRENNDAIFYTLQVLRNLSGVLIL